ncbi:MAG: NRDE family protein, partial [Acidobacteriota bacterium]
MCTATWRAADGGYRLLFNRDERRTRGRAHPPARHRAARDGTPYLAPTDPDGGGTWLLANAFGVTICLLNGYRLDHDAGPAPAGGWRSRGLLVSDLAD